MPLIEREAMSDEEMVDYLARCQIDPAAPRSSIETLLHAFVPAAHVHHTHPDGINVLAGTRTGAARRRVLRRGGGLDPLHPPGLHAGQAGRARGAGQPRPAARRARQARPRRLGRHAPGGLPPTIEVINQAAEFVNERAGEAALRGPGAGAPRSTRGAPHRAHPAGAARRGLERAGQGPRRRHLTPGPGVRRLVPTAATLTDIGAACPDHLVHTKRMPLWVPFDPAADDAAALRDREIAAGRTATTTRLRRAPRRRGHRRRRPRRTRRADPARRPDRRRAPTTKAAGHLARPLPPRDRGHGRRARPRRLHLAERGGELRGRVLAARALQALARAPAGRAPGQGRLRHRARRAGSAGRSSTPSRRRRLRRRRSTSTATAPPPRCRRSATTASRWPAT